MRTTYRTNEKHTNYSKHCIPIIGGNFNAELGPGYGIECSSVGKHTLNGGNKRGDWMKLWLMMQNFTALNTMYRKTPGKQTIYRSPKRSEKQIDCVRIKRRHLKYSKDAEANDIVHMGSDHKCVMATFMITTPKKDGPRETNKEKLGKMLDGAGRMERRKVFWHETASASEF